MDDFMFRFLISNLLLCGIIGVLLLMKRILKNSLSSRMQYNLWFLLLGLLAVPFMPFRFIKLSELFVWFKNQNLISSFQTNTALNPSKRHRHYQKYFCIQHCFSEISCYCGGF